LNHRLPYSFTSRKTGKRFFTITAPRISTHKKEALSYFPRASCKSSHDSKQNDRLEHEAEPPNQAEAHQHSFSISFNRFHEK